MSKAILKYSPSTKPSFRARPFILSIGTAVLRLDGEAVSSLEQDAKVALREADEALRDAANAIVEDVSTGGTDVAADI